MSDSIAPLPKGYVRCPECKIIIPPWLAPKCVSCDTKRKCPYCDAELPDEE